MENANADQVNIEGKLIIFISSLSYKLDLHFTSSEHDPKYLVLIVRQSISVHVLRVNTQVPINHNHFLM